MNTEKKEGRGEMKEGRIKRGMEERRDTSERRKEEQISYLMLK